MKSFFVPVAAALLLCGNSFAQRSEILLDDGWFFHKGEISESTPASKWQEVSVPHDWAIYGPFDIENDLQTVAVSQNLETKASLKTGRTGGLPYVGTRWYRRTFSVPQGKKAVLVFDGAMSEARVYVNGTEVCYWPYGYSSFWCDVSDVVNEGENLLSVRLENLPQSSRWYPGAGLYRNVHLLLLEPVHVPVWGTRVTTPSVKDDFASVRLETRLENAEGREVLISTDIVSSEGETVASRRDVRVVCHGQPLVQNFIVPDPELWSPEHPSLYKAVSRIYTCMDDGRVEPVLTDTYETVFGVRTIEFIPEKGFYLNGQRRKFQGVCNHHDLGPLGAAVNESALRHQLLMLKDMGCDAIRTSHNLPAPELVRLCDELGFMMMIEPFDEWDIAKCKNGYHRHFDQWAEKDMVNMLHQYRNNPCVVMWSIGNEVPTQCSPEGYKVAKFLQDICHREDPTRPVTCGMDQVDCILDNGFAAMIDIPGINYRTFRYLEAYQNLPQGFILGSETSSSVSSRGAYKLPAQKRYGARYDDHQSSAYDLESCAWANIPDVDFALAEDFDWTLGQFVWTGFDYLGEPSPYDTDSWPNHSSVFGIIDLASIPKDRFWLYRSVWNRSEPTLHVLPHWNWEGHEGENVPVFVYTSYPEAELFINGVSYGRQRKYVSGSGTAQSPVAVDGQAVSKYAEYKGPGDVNAPVETRYRLMWYNAVYQPGEIKVVAYGEDGKPAAEQTVRTAGRPHHIELVASYPERLSGDVPVLDADGKDLLYVTAKVVDKDGNLCPLDSREMTFSVSGAASYRAAANGDPTCLDIFHEPRMHAFNGMLTVIVQSGKTPGEAFLQVKAKGLRPAVMSISVSEVEGR